MRAVLDEDVPRDLIVLLRSEGCEVFPFPNVWKGTRNGRLLGLVRENGYDVLVTSDRSMRYQQNVEAAGIALLVLPGQRLAELRPEAAHIAQALRTISRGQVVVVSPQARTR